MSFATVVWVNLIWSLFASLISVFSNKLSRDLGREYSTYELMEGCEYLAILTGSSNVSCQLANLVCY